MKERLHPSRVVLFLPKGAQGFRAFPCELASTVMCPVILLYKQVIESSQGSLRVAFIFLQTLCLSVDELLHEFHVLGLPIFLMRNMNKWKEKVVVSTSLWNTSIVSLIET